MSIWERVFVLGAGAVAFTMRAESQYLLAVRKSPRFAAPCLASLVFWANPLAPPFALALEFLLWG